MKRVNDIEEERGVESSRLKKLRINYFGSSSVENCGPVARRDEEEENGGKGSELVDKNKSEKPSGITVSDNLDGIDELKNRDPVLYRRQEHDGSVFDLNLPASGTHEDGLNNGCSGYATEKLMRCEKEPEVISIASDDSDDEVGIVGYGYGYREKGKAIATEMPNETTENLCLGLGMGNAAAVGECISNGCDDRKYTKEEKGKTSVDDRWLSLGSSLIGLDLLDNDDDGDVDSDTDSDDDDDDSFRDVEPAEHDGLGMLFAATQVFERRLREQEEAYRRYSEGIRKETAKKLARYHHSDGNNKKGSTSKRQASPSLSSVKQLVKSTDPFSKALNMIRQRNSKQSAQTLIEWKTRETNRHKINIQPIVPSLIDLSIKALAENAEGLVSLNLVPDYLCRRLINLLCDMRKMNADILELLVKGCPTDVSVRDCSWLTEEQFQNIFGNCQTKDLRVLRLDLCGQCMLDLAFRDVLAKSLQSFSSLSILSLRGASRLSDTGLKTLVMSAPLLQSLNLGQCTLLTSDAINYIADCLGSNLKELHIDDCQKINPMLILPAFKKLQYLEVISVAGLLEITDQFVSEMISSCGQHIKEIDLSNCLKLTDSSLKTIGSSCAQLCSLNISNLDELTDLGIQYLANGCKSIKTLKLCRNSFSDDAVAAFLECSGESLIELSLNNMKEVGPDCAISIARCLRKLVRLDISWCRRISDDAFGLIVDNCRSLKLVKVFGCRQITNVFLKGHSNPVVKIVGLGVSPILDHMDLAEPEAMLLRYSALRA
ncbi:uncharacterized protein LOC127265687 [Andrographis paniculata]|uniref:uncharacterized protein LOC127265687 n=1 Tax=Andrographis paniculata TaxID=175694 RepID=UPI0021E81CCF|nr:uncharacterized protein LOC127265687 [Andrographis paniculata]